MPDSGSPSGSGMPLASLAAVASVIVATAAWFCRESDDTDATAEHGGGAATAIHAAEVTLDSAPNSAVVCKEDRDRSTVMSGSQSESTADVTKLPSMYRYWKGHNATEESMKSVYLEGFFHQAIDKFISALMAPFVDRQLQEEMAMAMPNLFSGQWKVGGGGGLIQRLPEAPHGFRILIPLCGHSKCPT